MKIRSILFATLAFMSVAWLNIPSAAMAANVIEKSTSTAEMKSLDAASVSVGEVKKIDKEAGKITIKHGPLTNLDMPPMTMVFRVKDPAMLDQVKVGDKINFIAGKANGALTVMQMQASE